MGSYAGSHLLGLPTSGKMSRKLAASLTTAPPPGRGVPRIDDANVTSLSGHISGTAVSLAATPKDWRRILSRAQALSRSAAIELGQPSSSTEEMPRLLH